MPIPELKKASERLLYPSESDGPFEPFQWHQTEDLDPEKVGVLTRPKKSKKKRPVEEQAIFKTGRT
jgi:hypothetical protein